jgi:DnaJ-domain-containing protein 1
MMENPFAKIMRRGFEAMLEAMQEELGRMSQQLVQGMLSPDMLASLMATMQQSLGAMGFDIGKFTSVAGQQPSFDPYAILGLDKSVSDDEVKKRYKQLVHILHPDKSQTSGTSLFFRMVTEAYEQIKRERGWK